MPTTTRKQAMRTAGVIVAAMVAANGVFFPLSSLYFDGHRLDGNLLDTVGLTGARGAFLMLTAIVAVASYTAALAPRLIGHAIAALLGLVSLIAAYGAFHDGLPGVVGITLLAYGGLMPVLALYSWRHSRGAWAFLIAMAAVYGVVYFFGATKVRGVLHVGLWTAMIIPALQFVAVAALAMVRGEYYSPSR